MTDASPPDAPEGERSIVRLRNNYEAFGMVLDLLSRTEPFRHMEVDQLSGVVRLQLARQHHVAAMDGPRLVGYLGWMATGVEVARKWLDGTGPLTPLPPKDADAAAVTIMVASSSQVLRQLVRQARALHGTTPVFFKRQSNKTQRKGTVTSVHFGNSGG